MKRILIVIILFYCAAASTTIAQSLGVTRSVTQYGITWTLSRDCEYGKFVNGDFYIVLSSPDVQLISISPTPDGTRNGYMVNPLSGQKQTFDSRATNFDSSAVGSLPLSLRPNMSIVSTRSVTDSDISPDGTISQNWLGHKVSKSHAYLTDAAILTVLSTHPPAGSFRPPYIGDAKPLYNQSSINRSALPNLNAPVGAPSPAMSERALERPWIINGLDWTARAIHPVNNMPNYHREVAEVLSEATLLLATTNRTEGLLIRYIQLGIDYYYMATTGRTGDSSFFEAPVIIAGALLGSNSISNIFIEGRNTTTPRGSMYYFASSITSTLKSSIVPAGKTWTGANVFFRKQVGNTEHEHLHPSEWALVANGGGMKNEDYRTSVDCHPSIGMTLGVELFGLSSLYGNDAVLAYADRWMTEDYASLLSVVRQYYPTAGIGSTRSAGSPFANSMWTLYRNSAHNATTPPSSASPPTNAIIAVSQQ